MHISERVKCIIKELGLNMNSFSKEIGLTNNVTIGKMINERRNPSYDVILKIVSKCPQFSLDWLIKGNGEKYVYDARGNAAQDPGAHYGLVTAEDKIASIEKKMLEVMLEIKELKNIL